MNIEEAIDKVDRFVNTITVILPKYSTSIPEYCIDEESWLAIKKLLTAYEKEKEKNNKIDEFCRKELAFERRLQRENREPDEFNQGRFYVSENIRKIIREE